MATTADTRAETELRLADCECVLHPLLSGEVTDRVVIASGDGCRLTDAAGREYLDATGGLWLAQVGHGRAELAEAAAAQMRRIEYFTSFWEFTNEPAIRLAQRLLRIAPESVGRVFFTSGGSEGDDAAIKMARLYFHRRGETERNWILSRREAYHGIAYGGGSATGVDVYRDGFGPLLPNFHHLTPAWPYRSELFAGQDPTDYLIAELEAAIERIGPERIAAFIGEPVMGVAGMLVPPADYWPRVQEVLCRHGILLILDEVVTAYGRVGEWFAASRYGLSPDIIVTAKGISSGYVPLGANLISEELAQTLSSDGGFPLGYTYNGHPTACAVGLANLEIIERENLLEAARTTGEYLLGRLRELERHELVGEVRGIGMMFGIELVSDRATRAPLPTPPVPLPDVLRRETGVIVRNCGHSLVLSPPLVLTRPEADQIVDALDSVLERLGPDGAVARRRSRPRGQIASTRRLQPMYPRRHLAALGFPGSLWVALFVATALYALIAIAVGGVDPILLSPVPAWNPLHWDAGTLQSVGAALKPFSGTDWVVFQRTCIYIAIALAGCVLIGYPVAYYVAIRARRSKGIVLALFVAPFLVSYMLRMLAWVGLLAPDGWVNSVLMHLHLTGQPLNWLSGRPVTVVSALIYGWVPYFILPLYASLARFDQRYLEASRDLGAGAWQTFVHVTLPLSKQGILAGMVVVALPMFGDFFTNALVSGTASTAMAGTLINTYAQSQTDQTLAAAAAVWLVVFLGLLLLPYLRSSARATEEVAR